MQALRTAATGMAAQELNVQVISNNIANINTTSYKKQTAAFQDLIYEHVRRVGAQASDQGTILPVGIDLGGGAQVRDVVGDHLNVEFLCRHSGDRKSTRLNSSHRSLSRMPSSA